MRKAHSRKARHAIGKAKAKLKASPPRVYRPGFKVSGKGHCCMKGRGSRMVGGRFSVGKAFRKVKGASRTALKSYARQSGNKYADVAADLLSKKKSVRKAAVDKAVGLALQAS